MSSQPKDSRSYVSSDEESYTGQESRTDWSARPEIAAKMTVEEAEKAMPKPPLETGMFVNVPAGTSVADDDLTSYPDMLDTKPAPRSVFKCKKGETTFETTTDGELKQSEQTYNIFMNPEMSESDKEGWNRAQIGWQRYNVFVDPNMSETAKQSWDRAQILSIAADTSNPAQLRMQALALLGQYVYNCSIVLIFRSTHLSLPVYQTCFANPRR